MMKNMHKKGFTLIELVVSIGILAILSMFLIATLNPIDQFRKARDGQRKSDLSQIKKALEQYYQDHGNYPPNNSSYQIIDFSGNAVVWGGASGWVPYMNLVPKDPSDNRKYVYYAVDTKGNSGLGTFPQKYYLYTSLEKGPTDPETCNATVQTCISNPTSLQYCTCPNVPAGVNCGNGGNNFPCNFGMTSPNTSP